MGKNKRGGAKPSVKMIFLREFLSIPVYINKLKNSRNVQMPFSSSILTYFKNDVKI